MIHSFACAETERLWNGKRSRKLPADIQQRAQGKLAMIDAADTLDDLKSPPSNRLHDLKDDRAGQHSVSINMKWRICFRWNNGNAYDVEIVDYH
ncbi:MAG: type II toxin-antitoxin system RelE/ParE family toxin [Erythrobacter sp.]|nr:type II toxin-antitoxin system RelE/ParE family toxin [Erythrobacter sp.]MDZ4274312.1 type II toxin-antitoxin system RelE/ParE family toxin [Erythrobacter sp.]